MPPAAAVAVPAALGVASLISGNDQQKAANANNLNQQAAAVQNAQNATKTAQGSMAQLIASNPGPFAGQSIKQPGPMNGTPQTPGAGLKTTMAPNPVSAPASPTITVPGATGAPPATTGAGGVGTGTGHMIGTPQTTPGNSLIHRILGIAA